MEDVLGGVGRRLRSLRTARGMTLDDLSRSTGICVSTLSRLESGGRKPTLELLLPLTRAFRLPLDDLVGAPPAGDPRIHPRPVRRNGMTVIPTRTAHWFGSTGHGTVEILSLLGLQGQRVHVADSTSPDVTP